MTYAVMYLVGHSALDHKVNTTQLTAKQSADQWQYFTAFLI